MATNIPVTQESTIEHLDPLSATHALHRRRALEARNRKGSMKETRNDERTNQELKFPSIGGGMLLGADCRELSREEHKKVLVEAVAQRGFYYRNEVRNDGRPRLRKRKTKGVHSLVVTVRPDHAIMLAALERSPKFRHLVRPLIKHLAKDLAAEFVALTGLEMLAIEVHPEEGNLHFHLTYSSVSTENRLLWPDRSVGRKGLRCLGPWHVGNLRLALAGYVPKEDAELAIADLKRAQALHGVLPTDWLLAVTVEGSCEHFIEEHGLHGEFAVAASQYGQEVRERRAERPDQLRARARQAGAERDRLIQENTALRERVRLLLSTKLQQLGVPAPSKGIVALPLKGRVR